MVGMCGSGGGEMETTVLEQQLKKEKKETFRHFITYMDNKGKNN